LLEAVGVPFEPATLRFFENDRAVRTVSSEQVRQPIYTRGWSSGGPSRRGWARWNRGWAMRWKTGAREG
jgi:hypothetical protein